MEENKAASEESGRETHVKENEKGRANNEREGSRRKVSGK